MAVRAARVATAVPGPGRLPAMRAVVWHGKNDVRVDVVDDPTIEEPTDAVIRVTSTAICGSDLHLYTKLWPVMEEGDILGHEAMGVVMEVGSEVTHIEPGDRVVVPFNISCGWCLQCQDRMYSQCETTQNTLVHKSGSLFGFTKLYGHVPGAQAEYLRVPQAQFGPIKVPDGAPTCASSCWPTCCPPPGRRWSMPACGRATRCRCTASAPWARWRPASPSSGARSG